MHECSCTLLTVCFECVRVAVSHRLAPSLSASPSHQCDLGAANMPLGFALVHLEASFVLNQEVPTPPCQLCPQWMGGGERRGGSVVKAGLSLGKCASISG